MATAVEQVRELVGEVIPAGGTEADTLFTNVRLAELIAEMGTVTDAAGRAWQIKAAALADLVDTAEGTSKRAMSDLHKHAVAMVEVYDGSSGSVTRKSISHRIVRS